MAAPPRGNTGHTCYFITASTFQKQSLFQSERMAQLFLEVLLHYRKQGKYLIHEFVLMPNHFHLLITPLETLERALQLIKGGFSHRARKELGFSTGTHTKPALSAVEGSGGPGLSGRSAFPSPNSVILSGGDRVGQPRGSIWVMRMGWASLPPEHIDKQRCSNRIAELLASEIQLDSGKWVPRPCVLCKDGMRCCLFKTLYHGQVP